MLTILSMKPHGSADESKRDAEARAAGDGSMWKALKQLARQQGAKKALERYLNDPRPRQKQPAATR